MLDAISIGQVACALQRPVADVAAALAQLEIHPSLVLNGVAYISRGDFERIDRHCRPEPLALPAGHLPVALPPRAAFLDGAMGHRIQ